MHIEDSHLCSFNAVLGNLPPLPQHLIAKRWICVLDGQRLTQAVQTRYRPPGRLTICQYILHHKNLFINTIFLEENDIPYRIFDQRPGDVVYLRPGVFHSVINLTPNIAEAINFGDSRGNEFIHLTTTCQCQENRYATF
ncbi:hypothetical protein QAD02_024108 [Eretmocerus hayati]|uniref:Uncharacterized protein n=1 Tax=Eretmocerus hayati TaxID=131215 RepID=A0ACC2PXU9_9HYME|nr:hypothetical protein QAD02_024108 [Eretmocerus hayati]